MSFMPIFASGLIYLHDRATGTWAPGGSCAAIGDRSHWLTASHCLPEGADAVLLRGALFDHKAPVVSVKRHPTADIAVFAVDLSDDSAPGGLEGQFFTGVAEELVLGADFIGYGYPVDDSGPVERILKGYFQRQVWRYTDPEHRTYPAWELSIPALEGASGAVLAYTHEPRKAAAVVTGNHDSYTTRDSYEEVDANGNVERGFNRRVISFGVAASLLGLGEWIADATTMAEGTS